MSVVDQLKNLFAKKQPESEMDSRLSLATPDDSPAQAGSGAVPTSRAPLAETPSAYISLEDAAKAAGVELNKGEMISVPGLGLRSVAQHQRILASLLGVALVFLVGVAIYALGQSDKVAQQLGATGQSLMQSQRLAKSVSQALVGSAQAFPDVVESADVLAKTTMGLQQGDSTLRLSALDDDYKPELEKVMPLVARAEKNAKAVIGPGKNSDANRFVIAFD